MRHHEAEGAERSGTSVFVVEDDERFRERLARALESRGCDVRAFGSAEDALAAAAQESPELAVVDLKLPGASGLDVVRGLHAVDPTTRIVVLTGYGSIATALESVQARRGELPDQTGRCRSGAGGVRRSRRRRAISDPSRCPHSHGSSGSTSSACSPIATATSPRPRGCSAFTDDRCSGSCRSIRPRGNTSTDRPIDRSTDCWVIANRSIW